MQSRRVRVSPGAVQIVADILQPVRICRKINVVSDYGEHVDRSFDQLGDCLVSLRSHSHPFQTSDVEVAVMEYWSIRMRSQDVEQFGENKRLLRIVSRPK